MKQLRRLQTLQATASAVVSLLEDSTGSRFVLKEYLSTRSRMQRERDFLLNCRSQRLRYLRLPEVVGATDRQLLLEYVPREHLTRDDVLSRVWTQDEIGLWVCGLLELQRLSLEHRNFTLKERLIGFAYPVTRIVDQVKRSRTLPALSTAAVLKISVLAARYLVTRLFFRNVLTHYDLQTLNYTFALDGQHMSLLDFEFAYYRGDPFFDVLYYLSIPPVRFRDWTFQKLLLREFLSRSAQKRRVNFGRRHRVRLILLMCNIARWRYFDTNNDIRLVYEANIRDLLDSESYAALWKSFTENK